ncbi:MAG: hypothetical protein WA958_08470 [Tunicatimonas sp.]
MKNIYQELSQKYTDEEIAESFILPLNLTKKEQKEMHDAMRNLRKNQRAAMTEPERMYSSLMQLKYQMTESVGREYDVENDFSKYLIRYMAIVKKTQKEIASDIGMTTRALSEILANAKDPDQRVFLRLENHSNGLIPALLWWKVAVRKQEYEITKNEQRREKEYAKVKNSIRIPIIK